MTEELEVYIPYGDLTRVSFACDCGTEITIDISSEKNRQFLWAKRTIRCATCQAEFHEELRHALDKLTSWHGMIEKTNLKVFFKVRKSSTAEK